MVLVKGHIRTSNALSLPMNAAGMSVVFVNGPRLLPSRTEVSELLYRLAKLSVSVFGWNLSCSCSEVNAD